MLTEWEYSECGTKRRRYEFLENGDMLIHEEQGYTETLEANKNARDFASGKKLSDFHCVASIPSSVFYSKLDEAAKNGDDAYIKKFLNDSDNAYFRTNETRL